MEDGSTGVTLAGMEGSWTVGLLYLREVVKEIPGEELFFMRGGEDERRGIKEEEAASTAPCISSTVG